MSLEWLGIRQHLLDQIAYRASGISNQRIALQIETEKKKVGDKLWIAVVGRGFALLLASLPFISVNSTTRRHSHTESHCTDSLLGCDSLRPQHTLDIHTNQILPLHTPTLSIPSPSTSPPSTSRAPTQSPVRSNHPRPFSVKPPPPSLQSPTDDSLTDTAIHPHRNARIRIIRLGRRLNTTQRTILSRPHILVIATQHPNFKPSSRQLAGSTCPYHGSIRENGPRDNPSSGMYA